MAVCRITGPRRLDPTVSALSCGLAVALGCEIVDPGPPVGVASRCVLSSGYFVERVVPELLGAHDCQGRDRGGCHDTNNGVSIYRLSDTSDVLAPRPDEPTSAWPEAWRNNFEATMFQVSNCSEASLTLLYSKPAGGDTQPHQGGDNFAPDGPELDLIQAWLDGV